MPTNRTRPLVSLSTPIAPMPEIPVARRSARWTPARRSSWLIRRRSQAMSRPSVVARLSTSRRACGSASRRDRPIGTPTTRPTARSSHEPWAGPVRSRYSPTNRPPGPITTSGGSSPCESWVVQVRIVLVCVMGLSPFEYGPGCGRSHAPCDVSDRVLAFRHDKDFSSLVRYKIANHNPHGKPIYGKIPKINQLWSGPPRYWGSKMARSGRAGLAEPPASARRTFAGLCVIGLA